jgi:hypothetical protein
MAALIFRRPMNGRNAIPYSSWLKGYDGEIVVFSLERDPQDGAFAHVERFESFDHHGLTETRAIELAAQLREWLDVPGQSYDSALAYRDKVYMKTLARRGGIQTAAFAGLETPLDLYRFAADNGYPCVVKPRTGAGGRDIHILNSIDDLKRFLRNPLPKHSMVEAFVDGPLFHVDGLVTDGRVLFVSPSRYIKNCLSFQTGASTGSVLLDPSQEVSRRLIATTEALIAALPTAPHFAFHAELFINSRDQVLLCEIACRPGGLRTADPIEILYGVDLYRQWVLRSFGLPIELQARSARFSVGRLVVPPCRGRLISMPRSIPFDWIADYRPNSVAGQLWDEPDSCASHIASFIFCGSDVEEVESRMALLDNWFRAQVVWEKLPEFPSAGSKVRCDDESRASV